MVKARSGPRHCVVALLAHLRKAATDVIRVSRPLEILQMARGAGRVRAGQVVIVIHVTLLASYSRVSASQREAAGRVIELGIQPRIHSVALLASGRELGGDVIRIRGFLVALGVARIALSRQPLELTNRGALMAGITLQGGVRSDQRKTILVVLDGLDRDVPTFHAVALLAIDAHLPFVNVGVAIGAPATHIREDRLGVTLGAGHILVHAPQRIFGLIVIEFGDGPDRLPPNRGVTVLAGNVQVTVRTPRLGKVLALSADRVIRRHKGQQQTNQKGRDQGATPD